MDGQAMEEQTEAVEARLARLENLLSGLSLELVTHDDIIPVLRLHPYKTRRARTHLTY